MCYPALALTGVNRAASIATTTVLDKASSASNKKSKGERGKAGNRGEVGSKGRDVCTSASTTDVKEAEKEARCGG